MPSSQQHHFMDIMQADEQGHHLAMEGLQLLRSWSAAALDAHAWKLVTADADATAPEAAPDLQEPDAEAANRCRYTLQINRLHGTGKVY